jgi:3-(3-hydroxy-phenyl)propionate hydroxylase
MGGCFVIAKPDTQLDYRDDVPADVIAIGDVSGRLKEWFTRAPESVVLLRPDRFVAGICMPQQVSRSIADLAGKLDLRSLATPAVQYTDDEAGCAATVAVETGA